MKLSAMAVGSLLALSISATPTPAFGGMTFHVISLDSPLVTRRDGQNFVKRADASTDTPCASCCLACSATQGNYPCQVGYCESCCYVKDS